ELWGDWPLDAERWGRSPREGAVLRLQRAANERSLEIEYSTGAPLTSGRFEVNGEMVRAFRRPAGRARDAIDISRFASRVLAGRRGVDFRAAASLSLHEAGLRP